MDIHITSHMQKHKFLIPIICLIPLVGKAQTVKSYAQENDKVCIALTEGTLSIIPLSENVVRIRYGKQEGAVLPELVLTGKKPVPAFKVSDLPVKLEVSTSEMIVTVDKQTGNLTFADHSGKVFLNEKAGSRKIIPDTVRGEPCYNIEQSFEAPDEKFIFGLGQFQDGHYNLKGVTRRLTQVNSQIAIPFIYSGNGYGLLWHQYGLTDYNPADHFIQLEKQQAEENNLAADVTTTSGSQRISQNQSLYTGTFQVPQDGVYSLFLDLGTMGNRHFVTVDEKPCLDQSNIWLPPTASAFVNLSAGTHRVQVICKSDNNPTLAWKLKDPLNTFRSPHAKMMDYLVFYGPSADSVIASYRKLSGNAPLFPLWAYGFWQCRERYTSFSHLTETVKEFRKRKLPLDVIVQDWQYWGDRGWGVPQFDEKNYPDPSKFISELHGLHAHFNISIWSNPDKNSTLGKEYLNRNLFIPGTKWLDYFNPETRKAYWNTLNENMFVYGVDSWWMDAVEPENDALKGETTFAGPGELYRLTYPLMVSSAVYEGQRNTTSDKRVCILTRSAFPGQQRYGIINWSGDVGWDWETFKRQITAGLNFTITGFPYWTTDIGGFFRPGSSQYTDEKYHELLVRWYQYGTFNPIFRIHGYQSETEPWKYGPVVENHMRKMLNLRYRLLPYIYSEAWQVTKNGSTMMRPMIMDFRNDSVAVKQSYQFMFGRNILVAPVTETGISAWNVYLPKDTRWYDFWSGSSYEGGQVINAAAPLERLPLFVKAGSIVPMGTFIEYAGEKTADTLEIRIYKGADGTFTLYEDENDNYNYENGAFSEISFSWDDQKRVLSMSDRKGSFSGMTEKRTFNVVMVTESKGSGIDICTRPDKQIIYSGKKKSVRF